MATANDGSERARHRAASAATRQQELAARHAELTGSGGRASPAEDAQRANRALAVAREHAHRALVGVRDAYLRAAVAHDRAAALHEKRAGRDHGDSTAHRSQAADHRQLADADRRRAAEVPHEPR